MKAGEEYHILPKAAKAPIVFTLCFLLHNEWA